MKSHHCRSPRPGNNNNNNNNNIDNGPFRKLWKLESNEEILQFLGVCVRREHHNFLKLCLRLLSNHLALALAGGVATSILGRQAGPLRNLLFRLMDSSVPDEIQEVRRREGC